jgi:hypothetical protein
MAAAPTFSQIKAQVAAIRKKAGKETRVVGLRSPGRWTGDRTKQDGERLYLIEQCDSPLAVRIALREELGPNAVKVLVTNLDEKDLSEDILVRLAKRRLFPLDSWQIVKTLFQAHAIDPRLTKHRWIADHLMECIAHDGCPAAGGGFLDAESVWPLLLKHALGLQAERPDLTTILRWSTDPEAAARYRAASKEFKEAATAWLSEVAGPTAGAVLHAIESNESPDALPIGLALGVVYHPKAAGKLEKAAGKMEERYLGRAVPDERTVERWGAAATEAIRLQITDPRMKRAILERADEILREIGAEIYAHLSAASPLGFDQRLAEFGRLLAQTIEAGRYDSIEPLVAARREVADHEYAARDRSRIDRIDMAIRLVRWLGESSGRIREQVGSLVECVQEHLQESGFVDWARLALRRGDSVRILSEAYARLFDRVSGIREEQAKEFAERLRLWTAEDHSSDEIVPVERVIEDLVGPLAAHHPILFVVIDGMSVAVCRELLSEIVGHEWLPLNREGRRCTLSAGLAALPSVTEVSRTSLFCGVLKQGVSADEQAGFAAHPALKAACRGGPPPILFHKPMLRGDDDAILSSDVRAEIAAPKRRVVGVVINAVDDLLLKGEQVGHRWGRESIPVLAALLHEAKAARRIVVVTSDHGHVIDVSSRFFAHEGGERWRTASGDPMGQELVFSGRRVVIPESKTLIAPWSENIRYGAKRYGYHGGANPQEMITPIVVLSPTEASIDGWADAPSDLPFWWDDAPPQPTPPPVESRSKSSNKKVERTLPLFELASEEARVPVRAEARPPEPIWIGKLLASPLFEQQKKSAGRSAPPDDALRSLLRTLDARGGKMTSAALSRSMNYPAPRLRGLLAVMQRVLNVDGFAVLTRDEASDTVELNRELLRRQFEVE